MAESCSVFGCKSTKSDTVSLHVLPKDPGTRAKWIQFIWRARAVPAKIPDKIRVCSHHFSDDSFVNFTQKLMGFASKLILNPYAVPSFYLGDNTTSTSQPAGRATTSGALLSQRAEMRDVGCQYEPLEKTRNTVATQLSEFTLKSRRSRGIQVQLSTKMCGINTDAPADFGGLISTRVRAAPSTLKRKRMEETLDEAEECEDASYHRSISSLSDSSIASPVPSIQDAPKYIVYEDRLTLLRDCPTCGQTCEEPMETTEVASQCDELERCGSPSSCSDKSGLTPVAVPESPGPSDASDDSMPDYGQMLKRRVDIDMISEKAGLLQMKGKYVVNEKRLLQLLSLKCPLCGSKLKLEKFTFGMVLILNRLCLQCEYRNQWRSLDDASVPAGQHLTGGGDVTPENKQMVSIVEDKGPVTGVAEIVAIIDEESDATEESGDEGDRDKDWTSMDELLVDSELQSNESEEESESYDDDSLTAAHSQLCTDCGKFFHRWKPHTCEHKSKPYCCNICGKRCVSESALEFHSRVHDQSYEHRCKYCCVTFRTKADKMNHEPTHVTQETPYKCPDCSETFATYRDRRIHLEVHRGPPQLKCHICGIEFNRPHCLQRHLAVHTGEKPFKCSVCQRRFNQAGHLKAHMRLHTGQRPYKCQHCGKCFNHNVSLKSHVQRYHQKNRTMSHAAQENKNSTDPGEDNVREEKVRKERQERLKRKVTSTGRPIGRPKGIAAGSSVPAKKMKVSNLKIAKVKAQTSRTTHCSDEDDEPTTSSISCDSAEEEEEMREKKSTSRARGRAKTGDSG